MFVDYYSVLEVKETASLEEIKKAFKIQAIKWHPDKNLDSDTHEMMQLINEAYLILKDEEARNRYDIEYQKFKAFKQRKTEATRQEPKTSKRTEKEKYHYKEYNYDDEILNNWVQNAKRQAVDLAKQAIRDFKGMSAAGAKGAAKGCYTQLLAQIAIGIFFIFIFALSKGCD
jgi:curved DNA-binding protein CbpA